MSGAHNHAQCHDVEPDADQRLLAIALGLLVAFMLVEVVAGVLAGSLALLSDAAHMLTDVAALGVSFFVIGLAARPAAGAMTFGFKRAEILSAQFNGASLLVLALVIVYEAIRRLASPPAVQGGPVLAVALAGALVSLAASWVLSRANRRSLNVEGAYQHMLTDLAAFGCTAVAGVVIILSGFRRADGIASLIVAAIMLRASWRLLRASGRVFLEAAPVGLDPALIGQALAGGPGVVQVHDLHVWEVTSGFPALSAHVVVGPDTDCHGARRELEALLSDEFGIEHTTLQLDHAGSELIQLELAHDLRTGG
ncbi:MAG: cation diffusion facilitator family transporter [Solirubrobacteraceae bacterium]